MGPLPKHRKDIMNWISTLRAAYLLGVRVGQQGRKAMVNKAFEAGRKAAYTAANKRLDQLISDMEGDWTR